MSEKQGQVAWEMGKNNPTVRHLELRKIEIEKDLDRNYDGNFQIIKKDVIDIAFSKLKINKIAELGCVWGVDGAYSRYISESYSPEKIIMVDALWNKDAIEKCSQHQSIEIVKGDFCQLDVVKSVGTVDAVIFFDILLHMVNPDWDSVLRMYADYTSSFLIVNPQYLASNVTMRLWDLDKEAYFQNVPHDPERPIYKRTMANPFEYDESQKKILRDSTYVWQWGITNSDLIDKLDRLGFELMFLKRGDIYYGRKRNFLDFAFIFVKRQNSQALYK